MTIFEWHRDATEALLIATYYGIFDMLTLKEGQLAVETPEQPVEK